MGDGRIFPKSRRDTSINKDLSNEPNFDRIHRAGQHHVRMNYKDTKPYMSAFLSVDLLTDFAAFCLTDFIDGRYIHSWFVFSTQLVNCCPHGRRNYTCVLLPLYCTFSLTSYPPFPSMVSKYSYHDWRKHKLIATIKKKFCNNIYPNSKHVEEKT
jgi:hypothetical protein